MTNAKIPQKKQKKMKKQDTSLHVHQNEKINFDLRIRELPWTERQQEIIDAALKKKSKLTIVDGIWGSGKSIIAVYACLQLLKEKKISNILYIRNIVQSGTGTLGWLGGDLETRLSPYMLPFQQKLDELLPQEQVDKLIREGKVESQPVALLRGTSYNCYGIIIDEAGCMSKEDILLALSRVGNFSYVFLVGDSWQVDVSNSGFREIFNIFNDEESIENKVYAFELQDKMDVMRSELLKFIMKKVKT
jgi:phosphate starvation-inducible PhoH-like protein